MAAACRGWAFRGWGGVLVRVAGVVAVLMLGQLTATASASTPGQLQYNFGPVLHSSSPYLVFWTPAGESIPAGSELLMERFFADVAAASRSSSNVFGVLRQYHDRAGFADYRQRFNPGRQVIVDRHPYPPNDPASCPQVTSHYPTCVSDTQIQSELQRLITAEGLPTAGKAIKPELSAYAPIYFVVLPANVDTCQGDQTFGFLCTNDKPCAWHSNFYDKQGNVVLYAAMPLQPLQDGSLLYPIHKRVCQLDNTTAIQDLNANVNADVVINLLSHEDSETITDPITPGSGWSTTGTGQEVGDNCERSARFDPAKGANPDAFLPTLGGSESAGTLYDQLINSHRYYLQSEWSNGNHNCEMRPTPGKITPRFTASRVHRAVTSRSFDPAASTSTHHLSSATWNFGDGSPTKFLFGTATLTRVKHRYNQAGHYTVTLTLIDNTGNLNTTTERVRIRNP